jgi:hypothetical protein
LRTEPWLVEDGAGLLLATGGATEIVGALDHPI